MTPDEEIRAIRAELTRRGALKVSGGDAFARGALDGVSFGFADEIGGAFGGNEVRDRMREELSLAQRDRPVTTTLGGLTAGLVPGMGVAGGITRGARALGVGARTAGYVGGAAVGGMYGAGSGTDLQSRVLGGGLGAGLGVAGQAAGEGIGYGVASLMGKRDPVVMAHRLAGRTLTRAQATEEDFARRLRTGPDATAGAAGMTLPAARRQARIAAESGQLPRLEPRDLVRRANALEAAGGTVDDMLLDVGPYKMDARAVRSVRGGGDSIIDNQLNARRDTLTPDVLKAADTAFTPQALRSPGRGGRRARGKATSIQDAPPLSGYDEFRQRLEVARKGEGSNYRELYGMDIAPEYQAQLIPRFAGGGIKAQARAAAINEAENDVTEIGDRLLAAQMRGADGDTIAAIQRDLGDAEDARAFFLNIEAGNAPNSVNVRAVDLYQRGLRQLIMKGELPTSIRRNFLDVADVAIPGYGEVRGNYRHNMELKESVERARKFFDLKETEQNDLLRSAKTAEHRDAIMVGVLESFEDKIAKGDARGVLAMSRKPAFLEALKKTAGSPEKANKLLATIQRKANQQFNANEIQGGSSTAPTQEAIRDLTDGADDMGFVGDFIQAGADPMVLGQKWLGRAYENIRQPGIRNPRVSREYARILTQKMTRQQMEDFVARLLAAQNTPVLTPGAHRASRVGGVFGAQLASRSANGP